ncbi:MAG TPA: hypothetical protein VKQ08_07630 [Cyclobacteriaceae bacterium]|nr:hypothetical protein [Cyclobacteriaceae bacterium]
MNQLSLPEIVHERNIKLIEYCRLRIKSYELIAKSIQENTSQYNSQIDSFARSTKDIIESLRKPK